MSGRLIVPLMVLLAGCAAPAPEQQLASATKVPADSYGVLVMAHGGGKQWNQDVLASLQPLKDEYNLEVAFGMADAASLQQGVQQLESRGARQIGVVRLFISGESFKERTEQILGMIPGAPVKPAASNEHAGHEGHSMEFWKIATQSSFVLSEQGLVGVLAFGSLLLTLGLGAVRRRRAGDPEASTMEGRFLDLLAPGVLAWTLVDFAYGDIGAGPTGIVLAVLLGLVARRTVIVPRRPS